MSWKIILDWIFSGLKAIEETYGEIGDTILNTHLFYSLKIYVSEVIKFLGYVFANSGM